jgi:hypothetical protein
MGARAGGPPVHRGQAIRKVIYVPNRLLNLVVG